MIKKNIIIVSVERCGASWVCGIISEIHKKMYGEIMNWNFGISRILATVDKYYFPKGFNEVLLINPLKLLNRPYDKIIIIKRDKESYMKAMQIYRCPELTYDETLKKCPDFLKECEFYYDLCYNHEFKDPRMYLVDLGNLNNYTEPTFSDLLDFLEYPKHTYSDVINHVETHLNEMDKNQILQYLKDNPIRSCLVPFNTPLRNWNVMSCQIAKDWGLDPMSIDIQNQDPTGEYAKGDFLKMEEKGDPNKKMEYTQFTHDPTLPNPYVLTPEEYKLQHCRSFRIYRELMPDALKILGLL